MHSLLALVMWGLWGFLPKVALAHQFSPLSTLLWQGISGAIATLFLFFTMSNVQTTTSGVVSSIGAGVATFLGSIFFFYALTTGKAPVVIMITALYPLVSIFLAFLFLGETITLQNTLGILFGIVALYFLIQ